MVYCSACGASMSEASRFCSLCGIDNAPLKQYAAGAVPQQNQPPIVQGHPFAHRGFGQMFGLDPRIAFLAFIVDFMLFSGGALSVAATAGLSLPVLLLISSIAGVVLGDGADAGAGGEVRIGEASGELFRADSERALFGGTAAVGTDHEARELVSAIFAGGRGTECGAV
jgi:hypothetical protein